MSYVVKALGNKWTHYAIDSDNGFCITNVVSLIIKKFNGLGLTSYGRGTGDFDIDADDTFEISSIIHLGLGKGRRSGKRGSFGRLVNRLFQLFL